MKKNGISVNFDDIEKLVLKIGEVISEVGGRLIFVDIKFPSIDEYASVYEKSIMELGRH